MATVKSLGLHQPAGLQHALEEQLLSADAKISDQTWDITDDGLDEEDELLTTKTAVLWSRGGLFRRTFNFELEKEPITQALLAYFPATSETKPGSDVPTSKTLDLEKALVVFLKTQAHIYFLSGTSHVIHMPFEVEAAYAAPVGVIIQRRLKLDHLSPAAFRFPHAPDHSFVSSQLSTVSTSRRDAFSPERLGVPNLQQLGVSSTLEAMGEDTSAHRHTQWPRLMSLTDPLLELGLVVSDSNRQHTLGFKTKKPSFLDPVEEVLHIEEINISSTTESLVLCITINRENATYTVWRLTYLSREDPFISRHKADPRKGAPRRSSMQPSFASGAATPVPPTHRESFGAPLPGKRQRKSERIEKPLDLVSSLEQHDKEGATATRRSSRRVSSMLARADLSTSHDRVSFAEQPLMSGHAASRRHESLGSQHARMSSSQQQIHPSLSSLLEAPFDLPLDEGLHNMGLDDNDFDGLQHEVLLTKLHTLPINSSTVRYSTTDQPARAQAKVFVLKAPLFSVHDQQRATILVGVQDTVERRLQVLTLHLRAAKPEAAKKAKPSPTSETAITVTTGELHKVSNVIDSCRLVDRDQSAILVLVESQDGRHELSTQAPWGELTKISLPTFFVEQTRSLQYRGRAIDRDVKSRKSEVFDMSQGNLVGIRHPRQRGVVDILDTEGRLHQLRIQLQPTCPQVRRVLDMCRSVLAEYLGERIQAGWVHVMQWLPTQAEIFANQEWSALTILIFVLFLSLGRSGSKSGQTTRLAIRRRRHVSGSYGTIRESSDWTALEVGETANSLGHPPWLMNQGWQWALDEDEDEGLSAQNDNNATKYISRHIALAREYMASPLGEAAAGAQGYLPTALSKSAEAQRKIARDIFLAIHLLLEEQKLDIMTPEWTSPGRADLRVVLCQLSRWLRWHKFTSVYEMGIQEEIDSRHDADLTLRPPLPEPQDRPDVFEWIQQSLAGDQDKNYLTPAELYYIQVQPPDNQRFRNSRWESIVPRSISFKLFFRALKPDSSAVQMIETMHRSGITSQILQTLPEAVLVPLRDAISLCQPHPPTSWSKTLLERVGRSDISLLLEEGRRPRPAVSKILTPTHTTTWDYKLLCQSVDETNNAGFEEGEGTERQAVIRALFKDDRRLNEAQDLLSTHKSRVVHLAHSKDWSESEYLDKQKELVSQIAVGTLAIPAGRALLYYSLRFPLITQKFHIGGFNLNCIVKPSDYIVGVDKALFTEEKVCWGFFHQGVAAGLAISPQAKGIDTSWILYNKPSQDLSNRHAGFLLALGLNGHLKGVAKWVAFKYLTPKHSMTSIGLLLGLAASYMGTMDSLITRLLSVHATRMLPRGAAELNLSPMTQTSAIMGIGLLYCGSQHRRMSEIMLSEIEHIDEEEEDEPLRSECYRLAAGYALGLINLGKGTDLKGLHDMRLTDKLISHATGAKRVEIVHVLDRASAGAVLAITLIFLKSEDHIVARKIDVPESVLQFDNVRPDILLLRTVAKNMILWSKIEPTSSWVEKSLPGPYQSRYTLNLVRKLKSTDLPFFSILAGICFSIALRFAGSASMNVRNLLIHYLDQFIRISRIPASNCNDTDAAPPYDEELARSYSRMCQDVVGLSAAIVMAGTGDVPVLRRLRSLHGYDDPDTPYGSHLATHLAIGTLFLGCGTATLGTSNIAIASMLVAFYPIFPTSVMDNRSHLQAFRHFWVLATEQRCLVTKDVLTGQPVSVSVQIKTQQGSQGQTIKRTTPCLLPPLDQIVSLSTTCGPEFWDVELDFATNDTLRRAFAETRCVYLRRRPPREGAFSSTLTALGKDGRGDNPLEWVFNLPTLRDVGYADRAAILQADEEQEEGTAGAGPSAVDARLEMERGVLDGGDRERLEGARMLFEWGASRERLMDESRGDGKDGVWWMKESDIEGLKGKVWLAGREAEQ